MHKIKSYERMIPMKKKSVLYIILIITAFVFVAGCGSNALKEENEKLTKEVATIKDEKVVLEKENGVLKEENKNLKDNVDTNSENKSEKSKEFLTIYSVNSDNLKLENSGKVEIDKNKAIKENLQIVANEISKRYFNGLPIVIDKVENTSKGDIAVINLKEDKNNNKTWGNNYFQGSAGGSITSKLLKENLLQKEYLGKWIDGIRFTHEGKTIEYQHVEDLNNGPFMRK